MEEETKKEKKIEIREILLRYFIGVVVAILAVAVSAFYFIFKLLTVWPIYAILKIFYDINLIGISSIVVAGHEIEFIDACIAGSAYLLLFLLNIMTREISFKKRTFIFLFDCTILLLINILRLIILIVMLVNNSVAFDLTHKIFWYFMSTIFVIAIWFFNIWLFKLKAIPFYSDIKFILKKRIREKTSMIKGENLM